MNNCGVARFAQPIQIDPALLVSAVPSRRSAPHCETTGDGPGPHC
jgi:hypothetical protein